LRSFNYPLGFQSFKFLILSGNDAKLPGAPVVANAAFTFAGVSIHSLRTKFTPSKAKIRTALTYKARTMPNPGRLQLHDFMGAVFVNCFPSTDST
jgi:hypothetical protein